MNSDYKYIPMYIVYIVYMNNEPSIKPRSYVDVWCIRNLTNFLIQSNIGINYKYNDL